MKSSQALASMAILGNASTNTQILTRPADTSAYTSGDLLGQSVTAGSVIPLAFPVLVNGAAGGKVRRARIRKSGTNVTNAAFRLHLFSDVPTPGAGDNVAFASTGYANYLGRIDITVDQAFSDGAAGFGVPAVGPEINHQAATIYGLLEVRGAYTPASAEAFSVTLESAQV